VVPSRPPGLKGFSISDEPHLGIYDERFDYHGPTSVVTIGAPIRAQEIEVGSSSSCNDPTISTWIVCSYGE
jgi:hypothetical protein